MGLSWRAMKLMHAETLATVMFSEETLHPVLSADLGGLWTHWCCVLKSSSGSSLVVQRLGLRGPHAGSPGLIPGQGTGSHMPQL